MDLEKEKIRIRDKENIQRKENLEKEERIEEIKNKEDLEKGREEEIRKQLSNLKKSIVTTPLKTRDEKKEIEKMSYPEKIGALVSLSFEKGIEEATSIAVSLGDPSLVDEFHDTLIDQYKERLLKEGIINGSKNKKQANKGLFIALLILIIAIILMIIMILSF